MGGGGKRGRTQRRHFKQNRENVWNDRNKRTRPDDSPSGDLSNADSNPNPNPNSSWQPFATQNPGFDEYYKEQGIVPEDEWDEFIRILRKPLPAAFRINSRSLLVGSSKDVQKYMMEMVQLCDDLN